MPMNALRSHVTHCYLIQYWLRFCSFQNSFLVLILVLTLGLIRRHNRPPFVQSSGADTGFRKGGGGGGGGGVWLKARPHDAMK